jgi:hypothetical protein
MPRRLLITLVVAVATVAALAFPIRARATGCPASACLDIIATAPVRPVTHFASGVTDSVAVGPAATAASLNQLAVSMYRSSPGEGANQELSWANWDLADSKGAATTLILQNLWNQSHRTGGYPTTPWSNWAAYDAWVASTVTEILTSGHKVTYWEPYSEPGWPGVYSAADFRAETVSDLLQQFQHTYLIIKALDPSAKVVGPGAGLFATSPLPPSADNKTPDVNTFLRFCAQNGIKLAAFAVHQNGFTPAQVASMVTYVRAAIAEHPGVGDPAVYVDEFSDAPWAQIPGWQVGYLSALEYSGAGLAAGSCWSTCWVGDLDNALTGNGSARTGVWYVDRTYAEMSGAMIDVVSNSSAFTGVASGNSHTRTVVALIGRDQGCAVLQWCRQDWYVPRQVPAPPRSLQVTVIVPWIGAAHVSLGDEAFQPNRAVAGPAPVAVSGLAVHPISKTSESVTFTIPAFADGTAYNVAVTG